MGTNTGISRKMPNQSASSLSTRKRAAVGVQRQRRVVVQRHRRGRYGVRVAQRRPRPPRWARAPAPRAARACEPAARGSSAGRGSPSRSTAERAVIRKLTWPPLLARRESSSRYTSSSGALRRQDRVDARARPPASSATTSGAASSPASITRSTCPSATAHAGANGRWAPAPRTPRLRSPSTWTSSAVRSRRSSVNGGHREQPPLHHRHPGAEPLHLGQVVRAEHHGAALRRQLRHRVAHGARGFGVEPAGGLVEEDDLGVVHQRADDAPASAACPC